MTSEPDDFPTLLAAARAGQGRALAALWRDLHPRLFRYLRSQEPAAAEDLASEAWLSVVRGLDAFEGDQGTLRRWAFTIARQYLYDTADAIRTRAEPPERMERSTVTGADEQVLESLSALGAVDRLRSLLTPGQTEVVVLRVVGGFDVSEVARLVGRRPGAVRALQHRALQRLSRIISPEPVTD